MNSVLTLIPTRVGATSRTANPVPHLSLGKGLRGLWPKKGSAERGYSEIKPPPPGGSVFYLHKRARIPWAWRPVSLKTSFVRDNQATTTRIAHASARRPTRVAALPPRASSMEPGRPSPILGRLTLAPSLSFAPPVASTFRPCPDRPAAPSLGLAKSSSGPVLVPLPSRRRLLGAPGAGLAVRRRRPSEPAAETSEGSVRA